MKVRWAAQMKIAGVEEPSQIGGAPVLKLAFKGAIDGEALANLGFMMKAPYVTLDIEQMQGNFMVDGQTGEIL